MIKTVLMFSTLLLISGCSFQTPANEWQHKSSSAFTSYTKNFLSANDLLAKNDLNRAVTHAKKSANLTQLAKIYLGECALNISAGVEEECSSYENISNLVDDVKLDAYFSFITLKLKKEQISHLPIHYQNFALSLIEKDFTNANRELMKIERVSSALLCASLIKENIEEKNRDNMIRTASYHGYKKIVLFWLKESKKHSSNLEELQKIDKKISILNSQI